MDFASFIRDQSQRLNSQEYVLSLWDELEEKQNEFEANTEAITAYNEHLPIFFEQFWTSAVEKLEASKESLDDIDEELRIYLLVLIYQTITQSIDNVSHQSLLGASLVYMHLLTTSRRDEYYKIKLYRRCLNNLQTDVETMSTSEISLKLMREIKEFLKKSQLDFGVLSETLGTLLFVIYTKTDRVFNSFDISIPSDFMCLEALCSLKVLLHNETVACNKTLIISYLFSGLKKCNSTHLTPNCLGMVQNNFKSLILDLHENFKQDHYKIFLNAFIHVWKSRDFSYFSEAVLIMNNLKEKHYRSLIDILNKMITSTSVHPNLFKLSLAIISNPSKHSTMDKVKVNNEILIKNILLNCLSPKIDISQAAIEAFGELLLSPEVQKEYILIPVKNVLNNDSDSLDVPTILRGVASLGGKKWGSQSRNKPLFGIILAVMMFSDHDYPRVYQDVLGVLSEEASPYDLKVFLPIMSNLYISLRHRNLEASAMLILKIMFKMSLHPMATSNEFVKNLYNSLVFPSIFKNSSISNEIFVNPLISGDFAFKEFFQKCYTLGLIKREHTSRLMDKIPEMNESNLKLLTATIEYSDYKDMTKIGDFVNDNFNTLFDSNYLNYLFDISKKILKKPASTANFQQVLRNKEVMAFFIKHHLIRQHFQWTVLPNAFSLLKALGDIVNLEDEFNLLKEEYDEKLSLALQTNDNFVPVYYYSQLVIFARKLPNENNLRAVKAFLQNCNNDTFIRNPDFNPSLWTASLLLFMNIAVVKNSSIEMTSQFLQRGLTSANVTVRLASLNMTFDLCNMVTHNFEDLINLMFHQLLVGDPVFKKTCLIKIDRLIRDDYLKLELEQYLIFVMILGDQDSDFGDFLNELLSEHFYISNCNVIAKYFAPLIIHLSGYQKHPLYKLSQRQFEMVHQLAVKVAKRQKVYERLWQCLPVKTRFHIIHNTANHILKFVVDGKIKVDTGFWKIVKDSIFLYKLFANTVVVEVKEEFYKKVMKKVTKSILQETETNDVANYSEYHKEIVQSTTTLLNLLFFNESNDVQKHILFPTLDAIIYWTNFLMGDLIHIIRRERNKELRKLYEKFKALFDKTDLNLLNSDFQGCYVNLQSPIPND